MDAASGGAAIASARAPPGRRDVASQLAVRDGVPEEGVLEDPLKERTTRGGPAVRGDEAGFGGATAGRALAPPPPPLLPPSSPLPLLAVASCAVLAAGTCGYICDDLGVHKVGNATAKGSLSLHVYAPGWVAVSLYREVRGEVDAGGAPIDVDEWGDF